MFSVVQIAISEKSTCLVITLCPYRWFAEWEDGKVKHRGDEYEGYKKQFQQNLWEQTCQTFPQLEDKVRQSQLEDIIYVKRLCILYVCLIFRVIHILAELVLNKVR